MARGERGRVTPEQLQAFHDEYTVASNGVIAVFGDVKAEDVLKLVEKEFGSLPAGKLALTNPPQPVFPDKAIDTQENRPKQQAVLMFGFPGTDILSADRSALELINEASNDLGSRFFNRIREQMGWRTTWARATSWASLPGASCSTRHRSEESRPRDGGVSGRDREARQGRPHG